MKQLLLFIVMMLITVSACKKDDNPDQGRQEGEKIINTVKGHKYTIASITDQNNADAKAKFPACIWDDLYYFKDAGTVTITQGAQKCGTNNLEVTNASWGISYSGNSVASLLFPLFLNGDTLYSTKTFLTGMFTVNYDTGEINLKIKVDVNTYTIKLKQTL